MKTYVAVGLLAVLGAVFLAGCSGGTGTDATVDEKVFQPAANYFPMAIGNSWTYAVTHDPSLITPVPGEKFIINYEGTMSIPGKKKQGGVSWFITRFTALIGSYDALARHDGKGLIGKDMPVEATQEYAIHAPLRVGTTWLGAETTTTYKITSKTKSVTVPAGTFNNCLVIFMKDTHAGTTTTATYAPGVGKILVVSKKGTQLAIKWELKSYQVAQ